MLKTLDQHKLTKKTIVIFLSDNGGPTTKNASNNGPLRGNKGDVQEGGFRVPYAIQWPGTLPKGTVYDHPVSSLDIFGTIAALSKTPIAADKPLNGVNLIPYLTGEKKGSLHDAIYLRKFDQQRYALRKGNYKLVIQYKNTRPQLFNLADDIGETKNIAAQNPEKLAELDKMRKAWNSELIDPVFLGLIHTDAWKKRAKRKKTTK